MPLQLITGKTRNKNPRTAMRCVKPGAETVAKVTEVLAPVADRVVACRSSGPLRGVPPE
ncbi:hypothetical protein GCM10010412_065830 [Nonomuraea recticatena]|uniref:Uncharacterized protein n=1 Tax=Nonomuraea recticatena TaxID=46178 RepID=A0ABN3SP91_9ACTN